MITAATDRLTARELSVSFLIYLGFSTPELVVILQVCKDTVECHRGNIYTKLGVRNLAELTLAVARMIEPEPEPECEYKI